MSALSKPSISPRDGVVVVQHGNDASYERPTAALVIWQGTVNPSTAEAGDLVQKPTGMLVFNGTVWVELSEGSTPPPPPGVPVNVNMEGSVEGLFFFATASSSEDYITIENFVITGVDAEGSWTPNSPVDATYNLFEPPGQDPTYNSFVFVYIPREGLGYLQEGESYEFFWEADVDEEPSSGSTIGYVPVAVNLTDVSWGTDPDEVTFTIDTSLSGSAVEVQGFSEAAYYFGADTEPFTDETTFTIPVNGDGSFPPDFVQVRFRDSQSRIVFVTPVTDWQTLGPVTANPLELGTQVLGQGDTGLGTYLTLAGEPQTTSLVIDGNFLNNSFIRFKIWTGSSWINTSEPTYSGTTTLINVFANSPIMLYAVQLSPNETDWSETRYVYAQEDNQAAGGASTVTVLTYEQVSAAAPGLPEASFSDVSTQEEPPEPLQ
jgi:hypothetical protein